MRLVRFALPKLAHQCYNYYMDNIGESRSPTPEEITRWDQEDEAEIARLIGVEYRGLVASSGEFSDTVMIDRKGRLKWEDDEGKLKPFMVQIVSHEGPEGLYRQARAVQDNCPDLRFRFEPNPEGQSIKYTVSTNAPGAQSPQS